MTNEERVRAFSLRVDGAMWEQIAEIIGYDATTVRDDLTRCVLKTPKKPNIPWEGCRKYAEEHCGGSVKQFALHCRIKPSTMYSMCSSGKLSLWAIERISHATGMSAEVLFGDFKNVI